jgi:putative N6-adenine-specific DNA methylase
MFEYQKTNQYTATIAHGLEEEGAKELAELGATQVKLHYRALSFVADQYTVMKIAYMTRLCSKILAPLAKFSCISDDALYQHAYKKVKWETLFNTEHTFSIFANVANSNITHSQYAALKLKDAIADYFRDKCGKRPSVDRDNPDVDISLWIFKNEASISFDVGHGPLHKRGYRIKSVEAPLQETLAAALVRISGWNGTKPLYDPFCGSGTILAEAGMQYCHLPPSVKHKKWGFQFLPDYDPKAWEKLQAEVQKQVRPLPSNLIFGSDIDPKAIEASEANMAVLSFGKNVSLEQGAFRMRPIENAMIICNPPYGVRLAEVENVKRLLGVFGDFLKQKCQGSTAWILVEKDLVKSIGLSPSHRVIVYNGDIECRFVEIVIR